jgi:hypothetical protein
MRSNAGLIFASTAFMIVLNGQWGQSTILGAAVISGGLALAASRELKLKSKMGNDGIGKQTEEVQINEAPFAVSAPPKIAESKSELSRE